MTRSTSLTRLLLVSPALLGTVLTQVAAQEVQEVGTLSREAQPAQMSEQIYRRLTAITELYGAGEIDAALQRLEGFRTQRLSVYEATLVQQTFGFCYVQQGNLERAFEAFEQTLSLGGLSNIAQQEMRYSLAAFYANEGRFEQAIATLSTWYAYAEEPVAADKYLLTGSSYAQLSRFPEALPYVEEAIRRAEGANESWYTLELAIHFELMDYPSAVEHLREMVLIWPDNASYWETLASTYLELQDDGNALATLMVAYEYGLIEAEARLLNLIRLNLFLEISYQAGLILEAGLADGSITVTQENLELLLSAWTSAREFDRALGVIDRLAPLADNGDYYLHKAQLLNERARWRDVIEAADRALEMGGLDDVGSTLVLKGMAQTELGQYTAALVTFAGAKGLDSAAERNAEAWIEYVKNRRQAAVNQR